jgi:hypothetical protein
LSLQQLTDELQEGPQLPAHLYVVASVGLEEGKFKQGGCSPNFQGSMITLCACKHHMRAGSPMRQGPGLWIAGITPSGLGGTRSRNLFYLMLVQDQGRFDSQAEIWKSLDPEVRIAKSASKSSFGDLYEPLSDPEAEERFDVMSYREPCAEHVHHRANNPTAWYRDIDQLYGGRRPVLLKGDPPQSYLWEQPRIRLVEAPGNLPRNPSNSPTLTEFLSRLVDEDA